MLHARLTDRDFVRIQRLVYQTLGINLTPAKKNMVASRLSKRLNQCQLSHFGAYVDRIETDPSERRTALDLLTTNETYFFREPRHFELLRDLPSSRSPFRVWSAASSSGEEAYSIAMVLADVLKVAPWEVLGSDISMRVLDRARSAHYPLERAKNIPKPYLQRFCLKGIGSQTGTILITRSLRERVRFMEINLTAPLPPIGMFDVIFLRNVMIYFDLAVKQRVLENLLPNLKSGGHLIIGHSESLHGVTRALQAVSPSVYVKP